MGLGTPPQLLKMVALGVDMFDCVLPTRVARNGLVFTPDGPMNLRNEQYRADPRPIVEGLANYTANFSRAYLRHLTLAGEILSCTLLTIHNLHFYLDLMTRISRRGTSEPGIGRGSLAMKLVRRRGWRDRTDRPERPRRRASGA
jgi:tRNA-guanine family transglycosylase